MEYIRVDFTFTKAEPYQLDLLVDALGGIGFDTFENTAQGIEAYIPARDYAEERIRQCIEELDETIGYSFSANKIAAENWNEKWEKNFSPLIVNADCYVRATFHQPQPGYQYEIVIDPKMAFGTGHHQTTTMMMQYILETPVAGKKVLDMGCGTGILAILASKCGAGELTAIDNDDVCYESTLENAALNNIENITAACGGKESIPKERFDLVLANINRNILLDQIPVYAGVLNSGGRIFFSGFYETPDLGMIKDLCLQYKLHYVDHKKMGEWVAAQFKQQG